MNVSSKRGLTLVELLIATVILSISLIAIFLGFTDGAAYMSDMTAISFATQQAQMELEKARDTTFANIQSYNFMPVGLKVPTGRVTVVNLDARLKQITVEVTWKNYLGVTSRKSLATLVTNSGINGK